MNAQDSGTLGIPIRVYNNQSLIVTGAPNLFWPPTLTTAAETKMGHITSGVPDSILPPIPPTAAETKMVYIASCAPDSIQPSTSSKAE